jgi:putative selenium metabolism hydrolase
MNYTDIKHLVDMQRQDLLAFAQRLIQTPSPSGQEGEVAALIADEMRRLSYDEVWIDEAGNVVGKLVGGNGPSLMLNGHMDHVDAGDPAHWPHPPFGGEIHEEAIWGRASVDMKGALAAMVYAGGIVNQLEQSLPGDLYVSAVVQEEVGGLGARHLSRALPVDRAIIGESSNNHLRRGHRGRVECIALFQGRSVHASMPDLGINPHYSMARFLGSLRDLHMASAPAYGPSTVVPTRITSEPTSANVTPSALKLILDWRNIPGEGPEEILAKLETVQARSLESGCRGHIELARKELTTHTGFTMAYSDTFPSFTTEADHPWLSAAQQALSAALGREVEVDIWRFATDGGHFAAAGSTVIGLGPGDPQVVHTVEERLPIDQLLESTAAYAVLTAA